jgi:hypothetical protein
VSAVSGFSLTILNRYPYDLSVFLDGELLLVVPAQSTGSAPGLPSGEHTLQYCQDQAMVTCATPIPLPVSGDVTLVAGGELPLIAPGQATPTPLYVAPTPYYPTPTEQSYYGYGYRLFVHNNYNKRVEVWLDGKYLMTVPAHKYLWHAGIRPGYHSVKIYIPQYYHDYKLVRSWHDLFFDRDIHIYVP